MRVTDLGHGTPEIAIVGGIHGDEPCGVNAVTHLAESPPAVDRPVRLVVANEAAVAAGERYIDEDLNRAFPGDPDGETHESRLAAELLEVLEGCATLALHSTQSYDGRFGIVEAVDDFARDVCPQLSLEAVVEAGLFDDGRIFAATDQALEVECGLQRSDAATESAILLSREFLAATGALPDGETAGHRTLPVFRLTGEVPKDPGEDYTVTAENFERVDAGDRYASVDGQPLHAEDDFYPVLMSPYGYETQFGYVAEKVGSL
jgi:predicted deacylase